MCLNGGNLILCDHCPRAVCDECVDFNSSSAVVKNERFMCLRCHVAKYSTRPYYVSPITCMVTRLMVTQGFYDDHDQALLGEPLRVTGRFHMTASSMVVSTSIAMIHFHLEGIPVQGFPPVLVRDYLKGYLGNSLIYFDVTFDVGTAEGVNKLQQWMKKIADTIRR